MKYCNYCKQEIEDNIKICPNCKHHLNNNDALIIFLKKHTKDKFLNDLEDNLFNNIKNYLLSHLYGIILTVTVIMLPISAISVSKVKTIDHRPAINNNYQQDMIIDNTSETKTLSEEDKQKTSASLIYPLFLIIESLGSLS